MKLPFTEPFLLSRVSALLTFAIFLLAGMPQVARAQCTTGTLDMALTVTASYQTVSVPSGNPSYFEFPANAGCSYTFTYCQGGGSASYDSYLTVVDNLSAVVIANDDFCGLSSELSFTAGTTGLFRVYTSACCPCGVKGGTANLAYINTGCVPIVPCDYNVPNTGNNNITVCTGTICDPGGPGSYPDNASGYTVINPGTACSNVQIVGTSTDGQACCDFVRVYDGAGITGTVLGTFNMGTPIPTLTSTLGPLTLEFVSDFGTGGLGFSASISCVPGGGLIAPTGISGGLAICTAGSTTLTVQGGNAGPGGTTEWFSGSCGGTPVGTGSAITVSPSVTTTYFVRHTGVCGSTSCVSATVTVAANSVVTISGNDSICNGMSTSLTASSNVGGGNATLQGVLAAINANTASLIASIPTPSGWNMDGAGGVNGTNISDGCSDMYDGSNFISTNLAANISYSDNAVLPLPAAFGPGGQHFTRYLGPGGCQAGPASLFFWAGDINGVNSIFITGNNGADGSGLADAHTFTITAGGINYSCFLKRVYNAGDPSINQLFMIPQPNGASHTFSTNTNDANHDILGLAGVTRFYYMLYAGANGALIGNPQAEAIAQNFLNILPSGSSNSYTWNTGATTQTINVTPSSNTTYTVTVSGSGCTGTGSQLVTVLSAPIAGITGPTSICSGNSATLTASGGTSYVWSTTATTPTITVSPTVNTDYTVIASNGACTDTTTVTLAVNPSPGGNEPTGISGIVSICLGGSTTLTAFGGNPGVGTIEWFTGSCGGTPAGTGAAITVAPTATTTYFVRYTYSSGCGSTTCASNTVTIVPGATITISGNDSICDGQSTLLTAVSSIGTGSATLPNVLSAINANSAALIASIPTPSGWTMDGPGGVNANNIGDGCSDMYDGGNIFNTNLAANINYSDNVVIASPAFGTAGQFFTRYLGPGGCQAGPASLWFLAADLDNVSTVFTTGNNGADGQGTADGHTFTLVAGGVTYSCFLKRVHSAFDPSINQIFMVPQPNSASHTFAPSTNDGDHNILGLTGVTRIYYMLYAGANGAIISNTQAESIAQTFLNILPSGAGNSYTWSTGATTQSISAAPATNTSYSVTVSGSGCSGSGSQLVTVLTAPVGVITGASSICDGSSTTLTASGGSSYTWSTGSTTPAINVAPSTTTNYIVTVSNGACTDTTATLLTVTPSPTANSGQDVSICVGASTTLNGTGGGTYSWDNGLGAGQSQTVSPTSTTTYTVTVTDVNNCTDTDDVTVTVNPLPNAGAGNDQTVCIGLAVTLNASGGITYNWDNGLGSGQSQTLVPVITTTYTVTVTDNNGCEDTDDVLVTVNPQPIANAGADTAICAGSSATISASGGTTYDWNNGLGAGQTHVVSPTTATNYLVTVTDANGCIDTDDITVSILPAPVPTISQVGNTMTASSGFATYQWFAGGLPIPGATSSSFTASVSGLFTVEVTDANGCTGVSAPFNLVGMEDKLAEALAVYPNPNDGKFQVEWKSLMSGSDMKLQVTDMYGKVVWSNLLPVPGTQILTLDLKGKVSAGVYLLQIESGDYKGIGRIVVE